MTMTPQVARQIWEDHRNYWDELRPLMRRLRAAYMMRTWSETSVVGLVIETSRGYELIESYLASLFIRDPSVKLEPDLRGKGDPEVTQEVANHWLLQTRRELEDSLRLSLIYPFAGCKLSASGASDVLRRVQITPVGPWDILVVKISDPHQSPSPPVGLDYERNLSHDGNTVILKNEFLSRCLSRFNRFRQIFLQLRQTALKPLIVCKGSDFRRVCLYGLFF